LKWTRPNRIIDRCGFKVGVNPLFSKSAQTGKFLS
jgi:hypothetical protein